VRADEIKVGQPVTITAKDDFYAFVDGWRGSVAGWKAGHVMVHVVDIEDGAKKEFLVPPDQLRAT
jgi:hypothetical protein